MRELYESGRLDSRQVLMVHRQEIREHTGLVVPSRPGDVLDWWQDHKSVFARELGVSTSKEDADEEEDEEETIEEGEQE